MSVSVTSAKYYLDLLKNCCRCKLSPASSLNSIRFLSSSKKKSGFLVQTNFRPIQKSMGGEAKCFLETTKFGRKIVALFSIYFGCLKDNKEKSWPTASNYKVIQEVFQLLNNNSRSYFWYHNSLFSSYFTGCPSKFCLLSRVWSSEKVNSAFVSNSIILMKKSWGH